jgi:4-hydroxy-tetrahydrodipicolinate reductase
MKIALVGYGRMGRAVERVAAEFGHEVVARIHRSAPDAGSREITPKALAGAEICVEFTHLSAAVDNFRRLLALNLPIVTGTTGWLDDLDQVREMVEQTGGAFLYAPNFSIGVNLFYLIADMAAQLVDKFPDYDPYVSEIHHSGKADSPSGTGLRLAEILSTRIARKQKLAMGSVDRKIEPEELNVVSIRTGGVPGTHTVGFEGAYDSITLQHANRGRESLALGTIRAVEWLAGRRGFYEFGEVISEMLRGEG